MNKIYYMVICLDDGKFDEEPTYTVATHKFFSSESLAKQYIKHIASSRNPIIVSVTPTRFFRLED